MERIFSGRAPEIKRSTLAVENIAPTGVFEGYASLFNLADLGQDVVMPGAFKNSLARRGTQGVKFLWQHDPRAPLGTWASIQEDHLGLRVKGRLNLDLARARETLSLMAQGAVDGLSIGFQTQHAVKDAKTGLRRLYKIDLWEISLVTFPMLPQARIDNMKNVPFRPIPALRLAWFDAARNFERALAGLRWN